MSTSHEKKRGRLSREEEEIISSNSGLKTDEEIAAMINREPEVVSRFRAKQPVRQINESIVDIVQQLHMKFFWIETRSQLLDNNEIQYFENYWGNLVQQFAPQGILPTDEQMMRDLVMVDIHVNRSNKAKRNANNELNWIEEQIEEIQTQYADDPITRATKLDPLHTRANSLRGAMKALAEEYKILADKKDKKYEQLKATRQMRLEKAEKAGRSFFDLVKMLDSPEVREKEARLNELYKVATEVARQRFEEYHTYDDGKIDRPFLTPEAEEK
jgi:hypothetical protein